MQFSTAFLGLVLAITGASANPIQSISLVLGPSPTQAPQPPPPQGGKFFGEGTYFTTGLGSCGKTNNNNDYIVAISRLRMDSTFTPNPNNNPQCGKRIRASHVVDSTHPNPPSITVSVADRCEACAYDDLDFTPSAYHALGCTDFEGRCKITWQWI